MHPLAWQVSAHLSTRGKAAAQANMSAEQFDVDAPTLSRYVMNNTRDPELVILLNSLATSFKLIASAVGRAGVAQLYGLAGEVSSPCDHRSDAKGQPSM